MDSSCNREEGSSKRLRLSTSTGDDGDATDFGGGANAKKHRSRKRRDSDFFEINVGGRVFSTSKSTLASASAYFASKFGGNWRGGGDDDEEEGVSSGCVPMPPPLRIPFVDQDPDDFAVLLKFMRTGVINKTSLTADVLLQAEFLGIDRLLADVKRLAFRPSTNPLPVTTSGSDESPGSKYDGNDDDEVVHKKFDENYGGIREAVVAGVLPRNIVRHSRSNELQRGGREYAYLVVCASTVVDNDVGIHAYQTCKVDLFVSVSSSGNLDRKSVV